MRLIHSQHFGKYTAYAKLGSGGMAEVYAAYSKNVFGVNKRVAIKVMGSAFSQNPKLLEMFKQETQLAVHMSHNNVASAIDFGVHQDQFFSVIEYVDGYSLLEILKEANDSEGRLTTSDILYIAKEASAGLDYIHRFREPKSNKPLNIIHCDISPQNIMVSREGQIKIIDFGVAMTEDSARLRDPNQQFGKVRYMSPEQILGEAATQLSDIFAFGIVLWELVAGQRIFANHNREEILRQTIDFGTPDPREFRPETPLPLIDIIKKATARNPKDRYQKMSELHREVTILLNTSAPAYTSEDFRERLEHRIKTPLDLNITPTNETNEESLSTLPRIRDFRPIEPLIDRTIYIKPIYILLLALTIATYYLDKYNQTPSRETLSAHFVERASRYLNTGRLRPKPPPDEMPTSKVPPMNSILQRIQIHTTPDGAQVWIDGQPTDLKTPTTAAFEGKKTQTLMLRLSGYRDVHVPITKDVTKVDIRLLPLGQ